MVDDDTGRSGPSLELPKLGRRRRRAARQAVPVAPVEPVHTVETVEPAVSVETVQPVETEPKRPRRRRPRPTLRVPRPGGMLAAVLTGVVVGLGMIGITWASLRGCEAVQGTPSCGGVGYLLLIVIMAVMVIVGALLLRLTQVPEPVSTSFLAVGLTAVLALMFLIDSLTDRAMLIVIPAICAGSFAAAHWVTRTFVEPATRD